jgi:RNA polymerase primary sigma factor
VSSVAVKPEPRLEDLIPLPTEQASAPGVTPSYNSALSSFMRDIAAVPLLTPEEEIKLAARIKRGDVAARERMIRANLRLVVKIARDYDYLGLPLLDLISEGAIGLMKAVDKFDPAKGGKLSTYASWWIKQQIRRGLANQGRTIRLPVHVEAKIYRLGLVESRLRGMLGRDATDEELASELEINPKRVGRLRDAALRPASLETPLGEEGSSTLAEVIGDDRSRTPYEHYESKNDQALLVMLIDRLPSREAEILRCRFGLDGREEETLEDVGRKFGLTRERIRQLQNEAFKKLREMMESPEVEATPG